MELAKVLATETQIERPKKSKKKTALVRKNATLLKLKSLLRVRSEKFFALVVLMANVMILEYSRSLVSAFYVELML